MRFALVDDRCDVGFMSNYSRLQATITRRTAMPAQTYDVWTFRHLVNVPCFAGVFVVVFLQLHLSVLSLFEQFQDF